MPANLSRFDSQLLHEAALSDAAIAAPAPSATAIADPSGTPNPVPSRVDLTQDYFYGLLRRIVPEGEFFQWEPNATAVAAIVAQPQNQRDAAAFEAYLRALLQAMFEDLRQMTYQVASMYKTRIEAQFKAVYLALMALFVVSGGLPLLLATDPDLGENLAQIFLGFVDGLVDSDFLNAKTFQTFLTNNAILGVVAPLTSVVYLFGTAVQAWDDFIATMEMVRSAVGSLDSLERIAVDVMDTMIGMMWSLLEDGKDEWHKFGYQMALPMGQAMVQDLRLPLDFNNPASVDNIEKLLLYAFNMGKYTGQVAVDVLMTICGVEFITGVLKVLKLGSSFFDELWPIIRRLIARVDSALPDELKGTAARVAAIIQARLEQFADEAVKLIDCTREEILNGFDLFKEWLKEPDYSDYVGCLFCNLAGKP